ncbi:hypothetical protein [Accumulibacter sp.]|jgi:hypothetical protein|uniref:hypothetical protein n=1 Tax=Accumulibacter sp. TaxID=2053492 RepID=UPI001A530BB7|nr:hypothetical protein [Accumulibacter sp.]MBL8197480.1 hypothetical protein [Chromatiales bacterium]MBN8453515.1 hypothetical protein [Accumulibacter sp.]MBO3705059.1 hypothetical protein [Candidatus Accumulibacter conexus]
MPKPQGTYLQTQKINKIALRARQSKVPVRPRSADSTRTHGGNFDLWAARNTAYLAHELGTESTSRGDAARRALAELVEQLDEMKDQIDETSETFAELQEPHFEFRAVTDDQQVITASNVLAIAMSVITLVSVLERALGLKLAKRT